VWIKAVDTYIYFTFHKSKIHGHETGHNKNIKTTTKTHKKIGRQNYNTIKMLNNNDIYKLVVYCMFQKFRDSIK
jgi:hypothetical protein